jgi:uncharacterized damage-inducible protein DinB
MRTTSLVITVAVALSASAAASAQKPPAAGNPIASALQQSWDSAKRNMTQSADVMPEVNYGFKPVDSVRTFGQILAHVAGANYVFCSAAMATKSPHAEDEFEKKATTRAAIIEALAASMKYCDSAYNAATDAQLAVTIEMPFGMGKGSRAAALMSNVGHLNEHYGNLVTYFRIKGIVPPSSRR